MATPAGLILYERVGCHLCTAVAEALDALIGPDGYERVDIDRDDELVVRYGFRVPVVALDGVDRLEAPITTAGLRALVGASRG